MKVVFASLLAVVSAGNWEAYKATYGKYYNGDEDDARQATYGANMAIIATQNAQNDGVTFGENQFTDMTAAQFAASAGLGYKAPAQAATWSRTTLGAHKWQGEALASSVDWSSAGAVTPVKNQGTCGSCWAFSTTGSTEGSYQIASSNLVSMSEQNLVDCSTENGGCQGGLMDLAFQWEESNDIATEASYPYTGVQSACHTGTAAMSGSSVSGFVDVTAGDVKSMMSAVQQQPVSVAIQANQNSFQYYKSGVLTGRGFFQGCGKDLDHGVLVVGYGTDAGTDYWKVKNSWGTVYGEDGYIRIQRDSRNVCGVLSQPSYPSVSVSVSV